MWKRGLLLLVSLTPLIASGTQSTYDRELNTWTLTNGWISANFQLSGAGAFTLQSIRDLQNSNTWNSPAANPSAPIRLQIGDEAYDAQRMYTLVDQYTQSTATPGVRQFIILEDLQKTG